jgi:hypothetical protein
VVGFAIAADYATVCYDSAPSPNTADSKLMVKIYGIKNCDTMKKAFAWCEANGISYEFHDYKKLGRAARAPGALVPHRWAGRP